MCSFSYADTYLESTKDFSRCSMLRMISHLYFYKHNVSMYSKTYFRKEFT